MAPDADTKASEVESISDVLVSASGATPYSVICTSESVAKPRAGAAFSRCSSMSVIKSSILNDLSHKSGSTFEFCTLALGAKNCREPV